MQIQVDTDSCVQLIPETDKTSKKSRDDSLYLRKPASERVVEKP